MYPEFVPLIRNAHLATIAGNFWPRRLDPAIFPNTRREYKIDEFTTVVALENQPAGRARAQLVCVHGLEGSAEAGYLQSLAATAVTAHIGVHRLNLRTCGGTEDLCRTMYHSGLTSDTWHVLREIQNRFRQPVFLAGFSLGGNLALKLAGEYDCRPVLAGVCSLSAPIDLAACVRAIDKPSNFFYGRRFLSRLKARIRRKSLLEPSVYSSEGLAGIRSIWEFDDRFTAPLFGFGTAANYYATQSASRFLGSIQIPALLITAQDDPLVPFRIYQEAGISANPFLELLSPGRGGHLGFLSREKPRFWLDGVVLQWMESLPRATWMDGTRAAGIASVLGH